jgi:hypothetical protein
LSSHSALRETFHSFQARNSAIFRDIAGYFTQKFSDAISPMKPLIFRAFMDNPAAISSPAFHGSPAGYAANFSDYSGNSGLGGGKDFAPFALPVRKHPCARRSNSRPQGLRSLRGLRATKSALAAPITQRVATFIAFFTFFT